MKLGYNTNGLAFHRLPDAIELIAETGFESVALTLDHHSLDPFSPRLKSDLSRTREQLERLKLSCVIETGARYLLNQRVKHAPTLLSPSAEERAVRIDFLKRAIDVAVELNADAVSFWSGSLTERIPRDVALKRLTEGCREVIGYAGERNVRLAFEPEPGMFIGTFADFAELLDQLDAPHFGLTIDVGHVRCLESGSIAGHLRQWADRLFNVHIEDMVRGIHEHLRFGEGDIDFPPVLAALQEIGYTGGVHVELSRHSHVAPEVMHESMEFLRRILTELGC
ncbi:MAG: sugar phosphate isomerase/epimerase [Planctomycetes bacterium]|nr:sugar phosphate isomerase/epimerase [Planctomycetota bacterium]